MDSSTIRIIVGFLGFSFGMFHLFKRNQVSGDFQKLEMIKRQWGEKNGSKFHLIAYVIIPIALGLLLIAKGFYS